MHKICSLTECHCFDSLCFPGTQTSSGKVRNDVAQVHSKMCLLPLAQTVKKNKVQNRNHHLNHKSGAVYINDNLCNKCFCSVFEQEVR